MYSFDLNAPTSFCRSFSFLRSRKTLVDLKAHVEYRGERRGKGVGLGEGNGSVN
jgi:hypothetical protein